MVKKAIHTLSLETILLFTQDKMQQLLNALKDEAKVLQKYDVDELENITSLKVTLTEQIEKNEQRRIEFLNEKSLDPNKPKQWLNNDKLNSIWQKIKTISEQSQKQNLINGIVINGSRRRIQAQINILSSSSPTVELVYSASGESVSHRDSITLAHV